MKPRQTREQNVNTTPKLKPYKALSTVHINRFSGLSQMLTNVGQRLKHLKPKPKPYKTEPVQPHQKLTNQRPHLDPEPKTFKTL